MREDIREIQLKLGLTSVYVTHDQEEALAVSDKIIVMNRGAIAQEGTPADLYERPANAFVADFIGSANLIPAEIVERDKKKKQVTIGLGETRIILPDRQYVGDKVYLVVRPSAVTLDAKPIKDVSLPAKIGRATYLGSHWEYTIEAAGHSIFVTQSVGKRFSPGENVHMRLERDHVTMVERN